MSMRDQHNLVYAALQRQQAAVQHPYAPYSSKLEADYAVQLRLEQLAGEIRRFTYEGLTFKLADGSRFTPDFYVVMADGTIQLRETKGFLREAARVRFLVARELYPEFTWVMIQRVNRQWVERTL